MIALLSRYLLPAVGVFALLAAGSAWYLGWRLDTVKAQRDAAKAALKVEAANAKIVTQYVEKVVKVPGPAVVRERLVGRVCHVIAVPGAGDPDAATGADTSGGRTDQAGALAADLAACRRNSMKLEALQEVLRPQL